jgi:pimeloyl-ACP methyl ester carboxylesterase
VAAADNEDFGIFHGSIISGTVARMYKPLLKSARQVGIVLLAVSVSFPAPTASASPTASRQTATSAETAVAPSAGSSLQDCRLTSHQSPTTVAARCGTFEVPEDYAHPEGKRLKLAIAVLPALDRGAKLAPVFLIAGGPGQGSRESFAPILGAFSRLHRQHDLVMVDQRGTGGSNALRCDLPDDEAEEGPPPTPAETVAMVKTCLAQLPGDPRFYTTSVAVRDLDAVRAAFGYGQVNLYGISYGSRVAQHYARRYPANTRAVVIDGVVPPGLTLGPDLALIAQRVLDDAFARCAAEAACRAAYPQLSERFTRLVGQLTVAPQSVTLNNPVSGKAETQQFTLNTLGLAVRMLSYSPVSMSLLPFLMSEATAGRPGPLLAQALAVGKDLGDQLAPGMHNAVVCTEDLPFLTAADVDREAMGKTYLGTRTLDALVNSCAVWPRGVLDADLRQPLQSKVPFLLLSGTADPVTPPAYAERAKAGLKDSLHVAVKGNGHGQFSAPCASRVIADFIAAGTTKGLEVKCLQKVDLTRPFFLDANGTAP